jgi:uncharacterized membrane protein YhaH (DUF805 family)
MARRPGSGMRWLLFSVYGRLSRKTYALTMLFWTAVLSIPVSAAVQADPDSGAMAMAGFGFILSFLLAAWSIAVTSIKRLHDAGLPGMPIPAASFFMLLIIMLWPSVKGPNKHGPGPDQPGY